MALVHPSVLSPIQSAIAKVDGVLSTPLALDFGGASVAYSLRDIGANGGPVVDMVSGGTTYPITAAQIASGYVTGLGLSAEGTVSKWYDQSGNGNHAVQATASEQPRLTNDSHDQYVDELGNPAIFFNTDAQSSSYNFFDFTSAFNAKSIFVVCDVVTSGNAAKFPALIGTATSSSSYIFFGNAGVSYAVSVDGSSSDSASWFQNGGSAVTGTNVGSLGDIPNNETNLQTFIFGSGDPSQNSDTLGQFRGSSQYVMRGSMTEFIAYTADKTSDRTDIRDNINAHYGIY
jgi:hypothetical protein